MNEFISGKEKERGVMATYPYNLRMHYDFYPESKPRKYYMVIRYLIGFFVVRQLYRRSPRVLVIPNSIKRALQPPAQLGNLVHSLKSWQLLFAIAIEKKNDLGYIYTCILRSLTSLPFGFEFWPTASGLHLIGTENVNWNP